MADEYGTPWGRSSSACETRRRLLWISVNDSRSMVWNLLQALTMVSVDYRLPHLVQTNGSPRKSSSMPKMKRCSCENQRRPRKKRRKRKGTEAVLDVLRWRCDRHHDSEGQSGRWHKKGQSPEVQWSKHCRSMTACKESAVRHECTVYFTLTPSVVFRSYKENSEFVTEGRMLETYSMVIRCGPVIGSQVSDF